MDTKKTSTKLGLAAFAAATLAAIGGVVYGRVRSVEVPRECAPAGVTLVCDRPGPGGERVDRVDLTEAIGHLRRTHHEVRLLPARDECVPGPGVVDLVIDPELDTLTLAPGGPRSLPEDPAQVGVGYEVLPYGEVTWEQTEVRCAGGVWGGSSIRLHPRAGATGIAHGLLHGLGWVPRHPEVSLPTGHVLDRDDPSLHDWRGVDGRRGGR
jgi:hypothetical protein